MFSVHKYKHYYCSTNLIWLCSKFFSFYFGVGGVEKYAERAMLHYKVLTFGTVLLALSSR